MWVLKFQAVRNNSTALISLVFVGMLLLILSPAECKGFQESGSPEPDDAWIVQAGAQVNVGKRYTTNLRCFVSIAGTKRNDNIQGDLSASLNIYTGGIGTDQGVRHRWQFVGDFNLAAGLTVGFGGARAMSMNVFHNFSGNTVTSTYDGSLSLGLIQTFSTLAGRYSGRNQTNGYVYAKTGKISFGTYNDFLARIFTAKLLRQNDSYWTGGFEIQGDAGFGVFSIMYDGFTGKRPVTMDTVRASDGFSYYDQTLPEQRFNNGITSVRFATEDYVVGVNHVGRGRILSGQWLQNFIHDKCFRPPVARFLNTSTESLQLSISGTWQEYLDN
jgi:hypothetical protein